MLTFTRSLIASIKPYTNFGGVRCRLFVGLARLNDLLRITVPPMRGTDRSCWRLLYTCVVCLRHVRVPTGGRCQGKPDRGNVYVRWRPRSCAPKKGAIVRCSLKKISVYISVTEPVEPLGSTLYLFGQLRSFGLVSDRYTYYVLMIYK